MPIKNLFVPELCFLDLEDALPGGLLPKTGHNLTFNGELITPLLPFNPDLFQYFTPQELIRYTKFNVIDEEEIEVSLTYQDKIYKKDYLLKEENGIIYLPVLSIYPNFIAEEWQLYYTFYYDCDYRENLFLVKISDLKETKEFNAPDGTGFYQINLLEKFPDYIICQDWEDNIIGLIIPNIRREIKLLYSWRVGIDFGIDFTNVAVIHENTNPFPLPINEQRIVFNITESPIATRFPSLLESFIPAQFLPTNEPLPLETVLTTKDADVGKNRTIFDGRIYIPDPQDFEQNKTWIKFKQDFTWKPENFRNIRLFLANLALLISSTAVNHSIKNVQLSIAYPHHFPFKEKFRWHQMWQEIWQGLEGKTGINYKFPKIDEQSNFCSQNMALGYYWKHYENQYLLRASVINMERDKTDICIWERNKIIHQCSFYLGLENILVETLAINPKFTKKLIGENWSSAKETSLMTKIDVWLRHYSEEWLKKERIYKNDDQYFQRLVTILALAVAGLHYYIGIVLKVLNAEDKYTYKEITPVYFGGKTSKLVHFLSPTGKYDKNIDFNQLLSFILSKASGLENTNAKTYLSQKPEHEIAFGLVLNDGILKDFTGETDFIIAGEKCLVNDNPLNYDSRLEDTTDLSMPWLTKLSDFLYQFHFGLESLNIESIKPLSTSDYQISTYLKDNKQLFVQVRQEIDETLENNQSNQDLEFDNPPFIIALESLIRLLGKRWADS